MKAHRVGRLALTTATTGFLVGLALLNGGSSNAIGGLCNGRPASHTWLDASGQYGPALLDGGAGVDTVAGDGGNDTVAGGLDSDIIHGGSGDDVIISADDDAQDDVYAGDDFDVCLFGPGDDIRRECEY